MKKTTIRSYNIEIYVAAQLDLSLAYAVQAWAGDSGIGVSLSEFTGCWVNGTDPERGTRLLLTGYPGHPRDPEEMHRLADSLAVYVMDFTGENTLMMIDPRSTHLIERETGCNCKFSDAWRCAVDKNLTGVVSCYCPCHSKE